MTTHAAGTVRKRNRRRNLLAVDPHCYWCGREVREYQVAPGDRQPDDLATLDHLNSRNSYPAGRPYVGRRPTTVLACMRCNQDRAAAEQAGREWIPTSAPVCGTDAS